jgi:hypothetical protein
MPVFESVVLIFGSESGLKFTITSDPFPFLAFSTLAGLAKFPTSVPPLKSPSLFLC